MKDIEIKHSKNSFLKKNISNRRSEYHRIGGIINQRALADALERSLIEPLSRLLPKILSNLDDRYFVDQFAVGYVVCAKKK